MPILSNEPGQNEKLLNPGNIITLAVIFFFALFIRLAYINTTVVDHPIRADARNYVVYAYNLVEHGVFSRQENSSNPAPDSFWAPGFPAYMAVITRLFGKQSFYKNVLYGHALMGAIVAGTAFLFAITFLPYWAALSAALLICLSPHLISSGGYLLTETSLSFFYFMAVVSFYFATRKCSPGLYAFSGLLFGYAYLVNPVIFFLPWIFAILVWKNIRPSMDQFATNTRKYLLVFLAVYTVFWGGWSVRNVINVDAGSSSSQGRALENLVIGTHPDFFRNYRSGAFHRENKPPVHDEIKDSEGSILTFLNENLFPRFAQDPGRYLTWYLFEKPYLLWSWDALVGWKDIYTYPTPQSLYTVSDSAAATRSIMKAMHPILLIIFLLGLLILLFQSSTNKSKTIEASTIMFITVAYITVIYSILQSDSRYSIPFRPELYIGAIWSIQKLTGIIRSIKT
ncbi:MAG TPA: hypothetical protein ENI65_10105 [Gammaproteobacteria bacterium]|nr:hypothetical protein [Gammaproteobacteria bacterium]